MKPAAAAFLPGILSIALAGPPEDGAWKQAMWDRLWMEGKTADEIESAIDREEKRRAEASAPPTAPTAPPRQRVDPALADEIELSILPEYRGQREKFRLKWDEATREGEIQKLQDYVLASIVHFSPPPEKEKDWLARSGLDEAALLAWVRSRIRCPRLQRAGDGEEGTRIAQAHLEKEATSCPHCAGTKPRILAAYVERLTRAAEKPR